MKQLRFLIIIFITQIGFTQTVDFDLIEYKQLGFSSSKAEVKNVLGKPNKIYEPNYECGGLSSEEQGIPFYVLDYGHVKFIGWDDDNYLFHEIIFENDNSVKLSYGKFVLTCETNSADLIGIFGCLLYTSPSPRDRG